MTYHQTIIDIIFYILSQGEDYLKQIDKGNAYDKIIRNYHQFDVDGLKIYRNQKRARLHYKFSEAAWKADSKHWYYEHLVPVRILKVKLRILILKDNVTKSNIKKIMDTTEFVVLTKSEAKRVDSFHKDTIPDDGRSRLEVADIKMRE